MADDLDQWLAASNQAIQSAQMIGNALDVPAARNFVEKMYKQQVKDNRENWQMQQAYNTPAMQMQRLKMAGLNPAMMMQGGADLGMAGSSVQAAGASSPSFAPVPNAPQYDIVGTAQADLMKAQADNLRATTPGNVKLQDAEYQKLMKDLEEVDSRIGLNSATISHLSAEDQHMFARLSLDAARLDLDKETAQAQIDLWNSQVGYNEALKLRTQEEYEELVAFRDLKRRGLDLSNQEIQSRMNLNQAQIEHYDAISNDMDRRFDAEYGPEGTAQFQKQLMKDQAHLARMQAEYWDDYKKNPRRYQSRVKKVNNQAFSQGQEYEYE